MNNTNTKTTRSTEPDSGSEPAQAPSEIEPIDPEAELLRAENETLKRSLQMRDARDVVTATLKAMGAGSPELLFAAIKDELQFDDEGQVVNSAAIAQHLRKNYPDQFGIRRRPGSIDGGAGTSAKADHISPESLARMTPAEVQKLDWAEVKRVLSSR